MQYAAASFFTRPWAKVATKSSHPLLNDRFALPRWCRRCRKVRRLLEGHVAQPNRTGSVSVATIGVANSGAGVRPGIWRRRRRSSGGTDSSANGLSTPMQATENGAALARQVAVGSFRGSEALVEAGMLGLLMRVATMTAATGVDKGAGGPFSSWFNLRKDSHRCPGSVGSCRTVPNSAICVYFDVRDTKE